MAPRRVALLALALGLVLGSGGLASAATRHHRIRDVTVSADGLGTLIAVTYGGAFRHVRLIHAPEGIETVAVADIDHDGNLEIVAVPRDGALMLWRYAGHGRFAASAMPHRPIPIGSRGPRFARTHWNDDGWQWDDDRHDAAIARAPAVSGDAPIAAIRVSAVIGFRPVSLRRFSDRAPPRA